MHRGQRARHGDAADVVGRLRGDRGGGGGGLTSVFTIS